MIHIDVTGLPVTVESAAAGPRWDRVIEGWLEFAPDLAERIDNLLAADPAMPAAQTLRAWLLHGSHDPRTDVLRDRSLDIASRHAPGATPSEQLRLRAVQAGVAGDHRLATSSWELALEAHPTDLVALRCSYFDHYERGRTRDTCRIALRALETWPPESRWQPFVQGMAAFALSELDEFDRSERLGREAAEAAPQDLWSVHAVSHVLEDGSRPAEGRDWLDAHRERLPTSIGFARHLWWHHALFSLALGERDEALTRFDGAVTAGGTAGHLDLTNAISLLARLQQAGVDVGARWEPLVAAAHARIDDRRSLFVHAHLAIAHAWGGGPLDDVRDATQRWARTDTLVRDLGAPLVDAALDWSPGERTPRPASPPIGDRISELGGSRAQRRLFDPLV